MLTCFMILNEIRKFQAALMKESLLSADCGIFYYYEQFWVCRICYSEKYVSQRSVVLYGKEMRKIECTGLVLRRPRNHNSLAIQQLLIEHVPGTESGVHVGWRWRIWKHRPHAQGARYIEEEMKSWHLCLPQSPSRVHTSQAETSCLLPF